MLLPVSAAERASTASAAAATSSAGAPRTARAREEALAVLAALEASDARKATPQLVSSGESPLSGREQRSIEPGICPREALAPNPSHDGGRGGAGKQKLAATARTDGAESLPGARRVLRRRAEAHDADAAGLAAEAGDGGGAGLALELVVCRRRRGAGAGEPPPTGELPPLRLSGKEHEN